MLPCHGEIKLIKNKS